VLKIKEKKQKINSIYFIYYMNVLHKLYINKIKCIKLSIYNDLILVGLAHWIRGDGTFKGITVLFCTDSYTIK